MAMDGGCGEKVVVFLYRFIVQKAPSCSYQFLYYIADFVIGDVLVQWMEGEA